MRYNEHYGNAYNFEVGYLEALRNVSRLLAASTDLETVREFVNEMVNEQVQSVKDELPNEE